MAIGANHSLYRQHGTSQPPVIATSHAGAYECPAWLSLQRGPLSEEQGCLTLVVQWRGFRTPLNTTKSAARSRTDHMLEWVEFGKRFFTLSAIVNMRWVHRPVDPIWVSSSALFWLSNLEKGELLDTYILCIGFMWLAYSPWSNYFKVPNPHHVLTICFNSVY
jgi:hypothetical protein